MDKTWLPEIAVGLDRGGWLGLYVGIDGKSPRVSRINVSLSVATRVIYLHLGLWSLRGAWEHTYKLRHFTFEVYFGRRWPPMGYCGVVEPTCHKAAVWEATWSDREQYVCDRHRDVVRRSWDNDHDYDQQGGISWERSGGQGEYESRKPPSPVRKDNYSEIP